MPPAALPHLEDAAALLLERAARRLARADRRLGALMAELGPCTLRREPGGFDTLFRSILGQQLSGKAAATIAARVHAACAGSITPAAITALADEDFARAGVSRQKRDYLRALAAAALEAPQFFAGLETMSDEEVVTALTAIRGVGRWTAEMYLMFSLGRLDVLPLGDWSIRAAIAGLYGVKREAAAAEMVALAEPWRPYRSVACWYLYAHLDRARPAKPPR